jgi:hypothetical protein
MRRFILLICVLAGLCSCNLYSELDRPTGAAPLPDVGEDDGGQEPDAGDDSGNVCTPQTDQDFCGVNGADCGEITNFDNCGASRTVNCGVCTDGSTCGERQANVCGCPCEIDGTCVAEGAINEDNPCEVCDPANDATGWSPRTGVSCTNDDLCAADAACTDQGVCETTVPVNCDDQVGECVEAVCDPADGVCKGNPLPDDTPCTDDGLSCTDDVCLSGTCEHPAQAGFCVAEGTCLADGESPDGNTCVTCDASTMPATLVNAPQGTSCGVNLACATSTCDGAGACMRSVDPGNCAINGVCYTDGEQRPNNRCQFCDVTNSQTDWTLEPNGASCRSPNCTCGTSPITSEFTCLRPNDADCN